METYWWLDFLKHDITSNFEQRCYSVLKKRKKTTNETNKQTTGTTTSFGEKFPVFSLSEIFNSIGYELKRSIEEKELGEKQKFWKYNSNLHLVCCFYSEIALK